MNFTSVRVITDDVDRLVEFYEEVLGITAERPAPVLPNSFCLRALWL